MSYITKLEAAIAASDAQLKESRRQIMWHSALVEDLQAEAVALQQMLDYALVQNTTMRARLGLPDSGDIDEEPMPQRRRPPRKRS